MTGIAAALLSAESGGGGLTDVNLALTVMTVVLFLLFVAVLARFGWGPLLQVIEEREKGVREAVEGAEKANAEAQALLEKHRELLREAGRERDAVLKRTLREAEQLRSDLSAKAQAEAAQLVERARQQIEREKAQAVEELRAQVVDIAVEAAAKLVASSLTPDAQRKLVADFIEDLPRHAAQDRPPSS
jgi:F-type H+-transporting ATPase subunit b